MLKKKGWRAGTIQYRKCQTKDKHAHVTQFYGTPSCADTLLGPLYPFSHAPKGINFTLFIRGNRSVMKSLTNNTFDFKDWQSFFTRWVRKVSITVLKAKKILVARVKQVRPDFTSSRKLL